MASGFPLTRWNMIAIFIAVVFLFGIIAGTWLPAKPGDSVVHEIRIEQGQGLRTIADTLKQEGLVRSKYLFLFYVIARNYDGRLQAGRYHFTRGMNVPAIAYRLVEGLAESDDIKLVIPEGSNIWDIDDALVRAGLAKTGDFARLYYLREGKLYPDTYRLKQGAVLDEVRQKLTSTYLEKSGNPDIYTLITASLLEREAKKPEDMAMIADIIYRRLERGMMLQIDATVAYGWCLARSIPDSFNHSCDVSQAPLSTEIKKDGEFNTYMRHGLPPRPISNPGAVAIQAAKHPIKNDYLYYLSTRDGSQIIYAKTGAEQQANRRKYLGL